MGRGTRWPQELIMMSGPRKYKKGRAGKRNVAIGRSEDRYSVLMFQIGGAGCCEAIDAIDLPPCLPDCPAG